MKTSTRPLVALWSLLAVLASCSDSSVGAPETVAPTDALSTVESTLAPTTTLPPPTTLPASVVFLRSDGFGAFTFGASYEGFTEGIPLERGSDDGGKFPVDLGNGFFAFDDTPSALTFTYPKARIVCFNDGVDAVNGYLCAYFGGVDKDSLIFVGWQYSSGTGVGTLLSRFGVTVNALASAVPAIAVPESIGCDSFASVVVDGINVGLVSDSGLLFVDAAETKLAADTRVREMSAGQLFITDGLDC